MLFMKQYKLSYEAARMKEEKNIMDRHNSTGNITLMTETVLSAT